MAHPSIITLGYSEAGMFLRRAAAEEVGAVISSVEIAGVETSDPFEESD